ncbi:MAG: c-type cytochrome [Gemmatimonadota bacterium]|nr:c-type cytochrome [Gemmatimonadota bacterium]
MIDRTRLGIGVIAALLVLAPVLPGPGSDPDPGPGLFAQTPRGKAVYDKWCAGCHGDAGAGDGDAAAYMLPRPRDFTRGVYQIRTTASGELPTDADIRRVVDDGMPGTSMPGWRAKLSESERADVVAYIKSFSRDFARAPAASPSPVSIGDAPGAGDEAIAEGAAVYKQLECFKCHGEHGRGDGQSAPTLADDWDHPVPAADLTTSWRFNGGSTVEQIYTRLRTGLDGTPMPSFSDVVDSEIITDEQLWRVAQYVRSLSPERPPEVREVIRAERAESALPTGPADSAWLEVEAHYVPLVAQIIVRPRWFAPMVDGVWVQAMHDGRSLALRLTWHDRSRSPDPAWDEWLGRVRTAMTDADGALPEQQGSDLFVVQFPPSFAEDAERPYFLGGSQRRPVYLWRWWSAPERLEEGTSAGLGNFTALGAASAVTHEARYERGQWQLQLTRPFSAADTARSPSFVTGHALPIAFYVADGSNGEDAQRGSVSSWFAIYLDVPTPPRVYIAPIVTMLLTAVLGTVVVTQAQRRERRANSSSRRDEG